MVTKKDRRHNGYTDTPVDFKALKTTKQEYQRLVNLGYIIENDYFYDDWNDYRDGMRDLPFREKRIRDKQKWKTKYTYLKKRKKLVRQ